MLIKCLTFSLFALFSGVFLPGLVPPEQCKGKDGTLNKPLCIAWSSSGRNHYIPLVAIKGTGHTHILAKYFSP